MSQEDFKDAIIEAFFRLERFCREPGYSFSAGLLIDECTGNDVDLRLNSWQIRFPRLTKDAYIQKVGSALREAGFNPHVIPWFQKSDRGFELYRKNPNIGGPEFLAPQLMVSMPNTADTVQKLTTAYEYCVTNEVTAKLDEAVKVARSLTNRLGPKGDAALKTAMDRVFGQSGTAIRPGPDGVQ